MSRWDFQNIDQVKDFDMHLDMAAMLKGFGISGINLARSWNIYKENQKIFYAIVDIKMNIFNIYSCVRELQTLWNRLDVESTFRFQRLWFEFVCHYRAFYDKYMGLMINCGWPDKINPFEKAKSKNSEFLKIVSKSNAAFVADGVVFSIPVEFSERCHKHIQYVNEQYRTPEVHGAGKARKWILSHSPEEEKMEFDKFKALVDDMGEYLNLLGVVAGGREFCKQLEDSIRKTTSGSV